MRPYILLAGFPLLHSGLFATARPARPADGDTAGDVVVGIDDYPQAEAEAFAHASSGAAAPDHLNDARPAHAEQDAPTSNDDSPDSNPWGSDQGAEHSLFLFGFGGEGLQGIDYTTGLLGGDVKTEGERGWLMRWLAMGGEGSVIVHLPDSSNISMPHRPAAFPTHLNVPLLPIAGYLTPFLSLPAPSSPSDVADDSNDPSASVLDPALACLPPLHPFPRHSPPLSPPRIALIERGGCDFATKVRSAQDRGAAGVIVGDNAAHPGETREEGWRRESLITMFSPEDTEGIWIPSVFVGRKSWLILGDILGNVTTGEGVWVDVTAGRDEGGVLTSLLSFALLMPSLFLLATIAVHRFRVARQREADRAPPIVVLSLPERIWTPDIVWEKDDSSSEPSLSPPPSPSPQPSRPSRAHANVDPLELGIPTIGPGEVATPPAVVVDMADPLSPVSAVPAVSLSPSASVSANPLAEEGDDDASTPAPADSIAATDPARPQAGPSKKRKERVKRQYFSKDECAICMDAFEKGDVVRILPCGHVFHKDECDEWLLKWRKLCPTCRADVTLPPGSNLKGSTLTPVEPHPTSSPTSPTSPGFHAALHPTDPTHGPFSGLTPLATRITGTLQDGWRAAQNGVSRAWGRRGEIRLDEEAEVEGSVGGAGAVRLSGDEGQDGEGRAMVPRSPTQSHD
ncbi:hypothetical protein IAT38_006949 [Cryptococcus sp. DSM 104549]